MERRKLWVPASGRKISSPYKISSLLLFVFLRGCRSLFLSRKSQWLRVLASYFFDTFPIREGEEIRMSSCEKMQDCDKKQSKRNDAAAAGDSTAGHLDDFLLPSPDLKYDAPLPYPWKINWFQVVAHTLLCSAALGGALYIIFNLHWKLLLLTYVSGTFSLVGMSAGIHRLWSHRSYKATMPLRILLAIMFTGCGQRDIFQWARDHRLHHKYRYCFFRSSEIGAFVLTLLLLLIVKPMPTHITLAEASSSPILVGCFATSTKRSPKMSRRWT